jgi:hypothetical protein
VASGADALTARLLELEQEIRQAQQTRARIEAESASLTGLSAATAEAQAAARSAQTSVERAAGSTAAGLEQARGETAEALRLNQEARRSLEQLEQAGAKAATETWSLPSQEVDPFLRSYREACEQIGVLPGSTWQEVRAVWRRNLLQWHPDQGGDTDLWGRRNAAYQLLAAWYEFHGAG